MRRAFFYACKMQLDMELLRDNLQEYTVRLTRHFHSHIWSVSLREIDAHPCTPLLRFLIYNWHPCNFAHLYEILFRDQKVACSNPVTLTRKSPEIAWFLGCILCILYKSGEKGAFLYNCFEEGLKVSITRHSTVSILSNNM